MGARHSKRSVDITTTPKKSEEGAAVIEGEEGRLEKIAEPDLKVTTNGTLHNEIEFADKEETSKDETEEKEKVENKSEIKENGLPEEPSNTVVESKKVGDENEKSTEQVNGETEKTPDKETPEQKVEETPEQKKKKEKKKKWSFRSISFSKKDKSKPSKESGDKNGEVKEVAEENAEDKDASPSTAETPKTEEVKTVESTEAAAVTNGEATPTEEPAKPVEVETPKAAEDVPQPAVESVKTSEPEIESKIEEVEEPKAKETVTVVSETAVETAPVATEEAPKVEESSKEVRTEEVPPPLPSSNPPSPVTVFAESTKADAALTSGQVPLEESKEVHEIIESSLKENVAAEASKGDDSTLPEPPVISEQASVEETPTEPVISSDPIQDKSTESIPSNSAAINPEKTETVDPVSPNPPSESEKPEEKLPEPPKISEESFSSIKSSTDTQEIPQNIPKDIPEPSPSVEDLPPAPPSPIPEPPADVDAIKEPLLSEPVPVVDSSSPQPSPVSLHQESSTEVLSSTPVTEEIKKTEESLNDMKTPAEPIPIPEPTNLGETSIDPPKLEPLTPPPTPAASTELPSTDLSSAVEVPSITSPAPSLDVSEPVAPADSLPDISTESLPSLPEPISESLPPLSLPPVDSVPDPIAPSESESSLKEELPPAPLTNGNMNGHASPSPVEEAILPSEVPGPTKQIASDVAKESEIAPDSGDTPSEAAVVKTEE